MRCIPHLERENGRVLSRTKRINECLAHKESNSDTNCHCDHCSAYINSTTIRSDPSCGRQSGLKVVTEERKKEVDQRLTGTRNSTPVTIEVNAVPPILLE